jgi:ABC-type Fe3+-hydroxamate transport system substrate-binding protein
MADDTTDRATPTRREYLKYGGVVAGGGLLAGCTGGSGGSDSGGAATETATRTESTTDTESTTSTESEPEDRSYTASMPPVGELTLDQPPSTWVGGLGFTADVLTALGHADGAVGMINPEFWYRGFYDFLDGVSAPAPGELTRVTTEGFDTDLEVLYDLEPDLMAVDPNLFMTTYGLDESEAEEVQRNIAPWFGNESRRGRDDGWTHWPAGEPYAYLPIREYVGSYGSLFGEQARANALLDLYDSFVGDVRSRVPEGSDRRTIGLVNGRHNPGNEAGWFVYDPTSEIEAAWGKKQYRDLDVVDAFDGAYGGKSGAFFDYEGLLEFDPDVIVFHFGLSFLDFGGTNYVQQQRELLEDHPVGSQLTAVRNDDLYVGGTPYQGPIVNMFQTEMAAKQLYPDEFGSYPGYGDLSEEEQLFDRERLAAVVRGEA